MQFSNQVGNLAQITNAVQRSVIGAQRVFEVIDEPMEVQSKPDAVALARAQGRVAFDNATFAYNQDEANAIEGITFTAEPGETIAILGATGSGKSTCSHSSRVSTTRPQVQSPSMAATCVTWTSTTSAAILARSSRRPSSSPTP